MTTNNKLTYHTWHTQQKDACHIHQQESGTTILAGHIWETPYITQAYSRTSRSQHDAYFAAEITAITHSLLIDHYYSIPN
jgi:hypothetical protein